MQSPRLQAGDLISYAFPGQASRVGIVIRIYRSPYEVKMCDVVDALFGELRQVIPIELCVKINDQ
jgi:hypothetical protein